MLEAILELLANEGFVIVIMAVLVCALTQLLKMPIKALTNKIATTERGRRIANATILLIPFGLGFLLEWLYSAYYLQVDYNVVEALTAGTSGISLYAVLEQFLKKNKNGDVKTDEISYDSDEGKAVLELIDKVSADGKIDEKDIDAVKDFWNTINK